MKNQANQNPRSKYNKAYGQRLIEHMTAGRSFESFASTLPSCSRATLYRWVDQFPEFKEAKAIATDKSLYYWEEIGRSGGQIKRLVKEVPKTYINDKGEEKAVTDKDGNIAMIKTYGVAQFNPAFWIFNMKNRFGWRDKVEIFDEDNFEGLNFSADGKIWDENK